MGQHLTVLINFFKNILINSLWFLNSAISHTLIVLMLNRKQWLKFRNELWEVDLALLELSQQLIATFDRLLMLHFLHFFVLVLFSNKPVSISMTSKLLCGGLKPFDVERGYNLIWSNLVDLAGQWLLVYLL